VWRRGGLRDQVAQFLAAAVGRNNAGHDALCNTLFCHDAQCCRGRAAWRGDALAQYGRGFTGLLRQCGCAAKGCQR